ncbi:NADH:quinone reductase (non-electrogenic) [Cupriavidus metallidurans]|jgi:nitronate monooxygenase|uniref:NAD(P)H-dependent flavin oxidoreductase n=1 Tax=Cupriavidus TaxID=106589 RepID=UPI0004937782|nr:nitronate monooxygenase [Cupriavidus metallidurans]AVA36664.1 nitronate monooxygenase [Cupriavidus metallidurans]KWW37351.1 Nitronate monooxygenase [Cupriavidus metallidurans]MDE4918993.1 nitronate monooxygenase [Cupriavidus metallidurans]UBM10175.1 nitronate monooxygenase [Cupriavidus metallidurans]
MSPAASGHAAERIFQTRLAALLDIRYPILLGGMQLLGTSDVVAAVVNAGAMGFITARSFPTLEAFRADLRRCRTLTRGRPFGVNVTLSAREDRNQLAAAWIDVALDEGVRVFESAGMSPERLVAPIHAGGGLLIHKCPSVRHAVTAQRLGVDAVALVGLEEGGHPGANQLSAFVNGAFALERVEIPLVIGGGIGSGRQIAAALVLGADGVVMGSRFMVAAEIATHRALKERIVAADEHCSIAILRSLNDTWRVLDNAAAREVQRLEAEGARSHAAFGDLILSSRTQERVYLGGDTDAGIVSLGPAGGFADAIESAGKIVERLVEGACAAWEVMTGRVERAWA